MPLPRICGGFVGRAVISASNRTDTVFDLRHADTAPDRRGVAETTLLLVAYAVLVAARLPRVLLLGRFWAEEGAVYFHNAWTERWYDALFAVHTGYINLPASLSTLLSVHLVPIADAPLVTTLFALAVQVCPAALVATADVPWLRRRFVLIPALLLIAVPPHTSEVWLNSITSQFHLALCTALILALPTRGGAVGIFRAGLLLFAGLSGPAAAFVLPLFALRTVIDRSRSRAVQTVLLGAPVAVELAMVWLHPEPQRGIGISFHDLLLAFYAKQIVVPLLGPDTARAVLVHLVKSLAKGGTPWFGYSMTGLAYGALLAGTIAARNREVAWLFAGAIVIAVLSYFGALDNHAYLIGADFGERYAYVPCVLVSLTVLGIAASVRGPFRILPAIFVTWFIVVGLITYFTPDPSFATGPAWRDEIARWRANPDYEVQFWPVLPSWRFPLERNGG